jgi:hypothetical protein
MRNVFATAFLALCSILCSVNAADHYTVVVELTGNPADGNTLVVQGSTKTFKTTITSPATQIEIGATAAETVDNILDHFDEYRLTNVYPVEDSATATRCYLVASMVDLVMTASLTGTWGTADVQVTSLVSSPLVLPLSLEPANQERTNAANYMVLGIRDYANTNFPATTPALVYFVSTTEAQTITGAKTFQNSGNLFDGGRITNMTGAQIAAAWLGSVNINGDIGITNTNPKFLIYDSDASANEKYSVISTGSGEFQINIYDDALSAFNTAFQIRRTGYTVDDLYLGAPLDVQGGATFNGTVEATAIASDNISGVITNANVWANYIAASNVWVRAGSGNHFAITNAAPAFRWYESDAAADNRLWDWVVESGVMKLRVLSDDGASDNTIFQITRDDFNGGAVDMYANLNMLTLTAIGATVNGPLTAQDSSFTFTVTPYLKLTNTTSIGSDPSSGAMLFAVSGVPQYRFVGSGTDHYLHNAAAQSVGAGTDYPFTTSYAQVTFGSGGNTLTLPTAGTYLVTADVAIEAGATANAIFAAKLYNATTASDIMNSERQVSNIPASKRGQMQLQNIVTVSAGATLHIYGKNLTDATGSIDSVETKLSYVRLY